ncbi:MAG: tetratricopeptide repeat protein [Sphingomonadaceae bacterium]
MRAPLTLLLTLLAASLLSACTHDPAASAPWGMQGVLRIADAEGLDAASYYQLARYHEQRHEDAAAGAAYRQSLQRAPRQLDARNGYAALLARQGQLEAAITLLRATSADFPALAQPLSNLGYVYYLQGDYPAARHSLQQALAREPSHARALANLALTEQALGLAPASAVAAIPQQAAAASAAAALAAAAPAPGAVAAARMEVVQIAPHQLRLQPTASASAIQIVNGNRSRAMSQQVGRTLAQQGYAVAKIVDQRRFYQRQTIIQYGPGQLALAQQMLAEIQPLLPAPVRLLALNKLPAPHAVRLVLGHDQFRRQRPALAALTDLSQE